MIVDIVANEVICLHFVIALQLFRQHSAGVNYPVMPLTIGYNSQQELRNGCGYGRHAETDAIYKLPSRRGRSIMKVDIIVIRLTPSGNHTTYSKPCASCISHMMRLAKYKYRVRYIWYTGYDGKLIRTTLSNLDMDMEKHITIGFKKKKQIK